jgi:hypothetical protein
MHYSNYLLVFLRFPILCDTFYYYSHFCLTPSGYCLYSTLTECGAGCESFSQPEPIQKHINNVTLQKPDLVKIVIDQ